MSSSTRNQRDYDQLIEEDNVDGEIAVLSSQTSASPATFKSLQTTILCILQIFITIAMIPLCFVLPHILKQVPVESSIDTVKFNIIEIGTSAASVIIYINVGVWIIFFLLSAVFILVHKKHKLHGYIQLHKKLTWIKLVPFLAISTGNVLLLLYSMWIKNSKPENASDTKLKYIILQTIICVQCAVVIMTQLIYLYIVVSFNSSKPSPDIYNDLLINTAPILYAASHNERIVISAKSSSNHQLIAMCESQSDIIEYLKHRCEVLVKKLHEHEQPSNQASA